MKPSSRGFHHQRHQMQDPEDTFFIPDNIGDVALANKVEFVFELSCEEGEHLLLQSLGFQSLDRFHPKAASHLRVPLGTHKKQGVEGLPGPQTEGLRNRRRIGRGRRGIEEWGRGIAGWTVGKQPLKSLEHAGVVKQR